MKILITAGSTWVKVDQIRILTNRFTGKTGLFIAKSLKQKGHSVTLLVNNHCLGKIQGLKVVSFRYFDELKDELAKLLKSNRYDAIVHMAAVSDYKTSKAYKGKIASGKKTFGLQLIPTEKLVKKIRAKAKRSLLIQFKLEPKRKGIIDDAYQSLRENKSDFVVANALEDLKLGYKGFLIDKEKSIKPINSKASLVAALDKIIRAKPRV